MSTVSPNQQNVGGHGSAADHGSESGHGSLKELFSGQELRQFENDDAEAGRRIGKILATLFVYTLLAMSVVSWWTFQVVQ